MSRFTTDDLTAERIRALVRNGEPEAQDLEYKSAPNDAMANTSGGLLLFGIQEIRENGKNTGIPDSIIGLEDGAIDELVRGLGDKIRSGIDPHIRGLDTRTVPVDGTVVVAVLVPHSIDGPHQLVDKKQFYARSERANYLMTVDQIRWAFMWSHGLADASRRFVAKRLDLVRQNRTPLSMWERSNTRVVMHVIPFSALSQDKRIDLRPDFKDSVDVGLLDGGFQLRRNNIDGAVIADGVPGRGELPSQYTQLFRDGTVEAVWAGIEAGPRLEPEQFVSAWALEHAIHRVLASSIAFFKKKGIGPSASVWVSLLGMKGLTLLSSTRAIPRDGCTFDRDEIVLDELVIEELDEDLLKSVRPLFDSFWRAAGHDASPNFDADGRYKVRD
jgi:hypothetical protein